MLYRIRSGDFVFVSLGTNPIAAAVVALASAAPGTSLGVLTEITPLPEGSGDSEYVATGTLLCRLGASSLPFVEPS